MQDPIPYSIQDSLAQAKRDSLTAKAKLIEQEAELQAWKPPTEFLESLEHPTPVSTVGTERPFQGWNSPVFLSFLIAFVILAWIRVKQNSQFGLIIGGFYSNKVLKQTMREEYLLSSAGSILLGFNFLLMGGMLVFLTASRNAIELSGMDAFYLLLFGTLAWLIIYVTKLLVIGLSRSLFGLPELFQEYRFQVVLFGQNLGLVWLPLLLLVAYLPISYQVPVLISAWVVTGLFFLWRLGKTLILSLSIGVSPFYLFLYLCTLEILPLVVLYKILVGQISGLN